MHAIRMSPLGVLLALTLLWAPAPARAQETAMTVSPGAGPAGQPFTIVVTGLLEDSDQLSIGIYYEEGRTFTAFRRVRSDANGIVRFTYDSTGEAAGRYEATILYLGRGNIVARATFTITGGGTRFFPETGYAVGGRFLAYWEANGGIARNGYPLSEERDQQLEDGRVYRVQYFERARLERHPENERPNDILLGQFGRRVYQARTGRPADPPAEQIVGAQYFLQTGHNLSDITADRRTVVNFGRYWQQNGGLAQFGYPLTEIIAERLEDGKTYLVQYFERARFEHHPENAPPYDILLGQFGRQILAEGDAGRR